MSPELIHDQSTQDISDLFRSTRKYHGLTQVEFCAILSVTQGTISKIEKRRMAPDLSIWFKFLRRFNVIDPYCFQYAGLELNSAFLHDYHINGAFRLAPGFPFINKEDHFFDVKTFRPLHEYLMKSHTKIYSDFLKTNAIDSELFFIHNHPLTITLLDSLFAFMDEIKVRAKAIEVVPLSFSSSMGKEFKELQSAGNLESLLDVINNSAKSPFIYEAGKNNKEFLISAKPGFAKFLDTMESKDLFFHYNAIYPLLIIKSMKKMGVMTPNIKEVKPGLKWSVTYSGF